MAMLSSLDPRLPLASLEHNKQVPASSHSVVPSKLDSETTPEGILTASFNLAGTELCQERSCKALVSRKILTLKSGKADNISDPKLLGVSVPAPFCRQMISPANHSA